MVGSGARRVLITRAIDQADDLAQGLRARGVETVVVPTIETAMESVGSDLDSAMRVLHAYHWIVLTSANGARAVLKAAERVFTPLDAPAWAVVGSGTRAILEREGIGIDFQPTVSDAEHLAAELPVRAGQPVVVVRSDLAGDRLASRLRARGADVDDVIGYRTREAPASSRAMLRDALAARYPDAVVFTSGSTVRGLALLGEREALDVRTIPAVCIGASTAVEAERLGFRVLAVSEFADATGLAATAAVAVAALGAA